MVIMAETDEDNFICCWQKMLDLLCREWIIFPYKNSGVDFVSKSSLLKCCYIFLILVVFLTYLLCLQSLRVPRVRAVLMASFSFTNKKGCFDSVSFSFWRCSWVIFSLETIHRTSVSCMLHQNHLHYFALAFQKWGRCFFTAEEGVENF